jgi:hypothetical protein
MFLIDQSHQLTTNTTQLEDPCHAHKRRFAVLPGSEHQVGGDSQTP